MKRQFAITRFRAWLKEHKGLEFADYDALWRWSTTDLGAFWESVWQHAGIESPTPYSTPLADDRMPGAVWFPGAQVNLAAHLFKHVARADAAGMPALVASDEKGRYRELSWAEMQRRSVALALHLRDMGVQRGDRVAAYLPNVPEAMIAFLAVASIGAIWSVCAPDMGMSAVLDRFRQIEPKVLIGCDGITYGGRDMERLSAMRELRAALPSVTGVVLYRNLDPQSVFEGADDFTTVCARDDARAASFSPVWVPFDHPLWIVYSSGTTGLPKPIVHGHGGIMLQGVGPLSLHCDVGPSYDDNFRGERFFWYSSTGWIMWNVQVFTLLCGCTTSMFDGNPAGTRENVDWSVLWRFVEQSRSTFFGAGAAFFGSCMKAGVRVEDLDLKHVLALGSTGSPLPPEVAQWVNAAFERIGRPNMWWANISGGTDFAGAFVGGNPELPSGPGEIQCRLLGCAVEAWNDAGQPVIDQVGELVCTRPVPSMPLYLWGDTDNKRYLSSYFEEWPGIWRHGDWIMITTRGTCVIYGRSDATINRHGLRMGTSEIYSAVESVPEVLDSMVVDLEYLGKPSYMPLFVVLRPGHLLDEGLKKRICDAVRARLSPRFVPDDVFEVKDIPRTLSGKKQELPIKKLLLGQPVEKVLNPSAMANPDCLGWYVEFAKQRAAAMA